MPLTIENKSALTSIPLQNVPASNQAAQKGRISGLEIKDLMKDFKIGFIDKILSKIWCCCYASKIESLKDAHVTAKLKDAFNDLKSRVTTLSSEDKSDLVSLKASCLQLETQTKDGYLGLQLRVLNTKLEILEKEVAAAQVKDLPPSSFSSNNTTTTSTASKEEKADKTATTKPATTVTQAIVPSVLKAIDELQTLNQQPISAENLKKMQEAYNKAMQSHPTRDLQLLLEQWKTRLQDISQKLADVESTATRTISPTKNTGSRAVTIEDEDENVDDEAEFLISNSTLCADEKTFIPDELFELKAHFEWLKKHPNTTSDNLDQVTKSLFNAEIHLALVTIGIEENKIPANIKSIRTTLRQREEALPVFQAEAMKKIVERNKSLQKLRLPLTLENLKEMRAAYQAAMAITVPQFFST